MDESSSGSTSGSMTGSVSGNASGGTSASGSGGTRARGASSGRRRLVLGAGASLALPAIALPGCASRAPTVQQTRPFEQPRVQVGDRWLYTEINRYNQLPLAQVEVTVTAAVPLTCSVRRTPGDITAGHIARPEPFAVERYTEPWAVAVEPTYDLTMNFLDPMPILPAQLRLGESSYQKTRYTVEGISGRYRWTQRLKATDIERIATPGGTFECLRVDRVIWFEYPDAFRFNSSRVDRVWYAPEVNRWVRREWTGDYQHENFLGKRGGDRRREDWVRWDLTGYQPA